MRCNTTPVWLRPALWWGQVGGFWCYAKVRSKEVCELWSVSVCELNVNMWPGTLIQEATLHACSLATADTLRVSSWMSSCMYICDMWICVIEPSWIHRYVITNPDSSLHRREVEGKYNTWKHALKSRRWWWWICIWCFCDIPVNQYSFWQLDASHWHPHYFQQYGVWELFTSDRC